MRPPSLVLRLTAYFALGSGAVLLGLGWVVAMAIEAHFVDLDRDTLVGKVHLVHGVAAQHGGLASGGQVGALSLAQRLATVLPASFGGHHDIYARVIGPDGGLIFQAEGIAFPADLAYQPISGDRLIAWEDGGRRFRGLAVELPVGEDEETLRLAVAIDTAHHDQFMGEFRRTLAGYVLAAMLASGFLGWLAARRGLMPLRAMRSRAAKVTANHLDQRMPVASLPAEVADLAAELNDMLARLEDAFRRLSEFSSDLAHELRTPISNLLTQTEVSLSHPRSADEYRDILASNVEELQQLARMVADMLFLAKAEHGLVLPSREAVAMAGEVRALFDFYEAAAEDKGVTLRCRGDANVVGDRLMIRRAIHNLLSNALRHTPPGGLIEVQIGEGDSGSARDIEVAVENSGEAIPDDRLPHLFDRFFRVDRARSHRDDEGADGAGLGLAITRAIVAAHGGRVGVVSGGGRNRFWLRFPGGDGSLR